MTCLSRTDAFSRLILPSLPVNIAVLRCPTTRREAPQRILIVKFGALGDILMTTPLLTALRRAYPEAHITWAAEDTNVGAIEANPYVDEILLWNSGHWRLMRSTKPRNWLKNQFGLRWLMQALRLKWLLHRRFNVFISFHPEQWQFLLNAVAPSTSIGVFESPGQAKRDYATRYTKAYTAADFGVHQTDTYLLPLDGLGLPPAADKRMVIGYPAEDAETVDALLAGENIGAGFIVLAPKTTWASKLWPEDRWIALGDALRQAGSGRAVVLIGSPSEAEAVRHIAAAMQPPAVTLAGRLSFRQAAALLARAAVCVSSDSGPMHLASAVGTPTVSLFGPTPPERYAPLSGAGRVLRHLVPCGPCLEQACPNPPETQLRCMRLLTVAEVLDAVTEAIRC